MVNNTMDALEWLRKQLDSDENDLVREMVREFAQRLMAAEVHALTGAGWGEVNPERVNHRNGYREGGLRHPRRADRPGDPQAAQRQLLPELP